MQPVWRTTRYFKHWKHQNLWINNKAKGDKYSVCLHFLTHLLNICRKFEFLISQGSVATYLRWDGCRRMGFVANFIRFPAVRKFWKSVKIWQSYREFKGDNFFETQCISELVAKITNFHCNWLVCLPMHLHSYHSMWKPTEQKLTEWVCRV